MTFTDNSQVTAVKFVHDDTWDSIKATYVRGSAFYDGQYKSSEEIAKLLSDTTSTADLRSVLDQLNGHFAFVHEMEGEIIAAVDHLSSTPLFYALHDGKVYLSDSAQWIHTQLSCGYDATAVTEYLFTGYVTGQDTLSTGVNQLRAGEWVVFDNTGTPTINRQEKYHTLTLGDGGRNPTFEEIDGVLISAFRRFVRALDGRTALVSLSGGYDSRLIALMLSRLEYDNVILYTHDLPSGSPTDVQIAQEIVDKLNYDHITISPTHNDFRDFATSDEWEEFCTEVDYLSSIPNIHETVVLQILQSHSIVPDDAVDVRGHLPIPHGGPSFPPHLTNSGTMSKSQFQTEIWESHYGMWSDNAISESMTDHLENRIIDAIPTAAYKDTREEPGEVVAEALSAWYSQERTAKYLVFDHEYDYLGFDRWFPLWDREYLDLLKDVELSELIDKRIHKRYVSRLSADILGKDYPDFNSASSLANEPSFASIILSSLASGMGYLPETAKTAIREMYHGVRTSGIYDLYETDPRYGLVSEQRFDDFKLRRASPETFASLYLYYDGKLDIEKDTDLNRVSPE
ncbi:hypothetical protein [Halostagnicola kamekurae]|uniref:Asparagine synthase (Glutamine-hydrolysing) n=1 Tax=Halostagnicola kamekurae TaxID=619731 RepID=A0A1I6QNW8_9EURY|nr:hypothetical protein [Halostagnicola kamekurae]SFS54084.1 hypothetical protein SAMN04488556_1407 [Halostagnicola kamekurae]